MREGEVLRVSILVFFCLTFTAAPALGAQMHRGALGAIEVSVSRHFSPHRWSWTARQLMLHAELSCAAMAAWHCEPPRNSCSPAWMETSWATSCCSTAAAAG